MGTLKITDSRSPNRQWAPLIFIAAAVLLVTVVCFVGLANDLSNRRKLIYAAEIGKLQSHIERTIVRIESDLRDGKTLSDFTEPHVQPWLRDHWNRVVVEKQDRSYAKIEGRTGEVYAVGGILDNPENLEPAASPLEGFPSNVRKISIQQKGRWIDVIEVQVPVGNRDQVLATYSTAIPVTWLENRVVEAQRSRWVVWLTILLSMIAIVSVTSVSLFRLGKHARALEEALRTAETRRLADLSRLIVGIAHELRNPLNAVRLNLFTSEKLIRGEANVPIDEASMMIRESVSELERVNDLIGQLLGFARIENQQEAWIDIDRELTAVLNFMKQIHEHHRIHVTILMDAPHAQAMISSKHFRQILLNLLQNARDAMPEGGHIRISLENNQNGILLAFEDDGPGIAESMYEKIFEPFYSSRRDGVGLGLAVVRNLLEANGGVITCQASPDLGGLRFELHLQGHFEGNSGADDPSPESQVSRFPIPDPINTQQNEYGPVYSRR